ncbi:MAG: N-acetylmuramoyl-L-alanine amidase [Sciscionella sp.]
MLDPGHNGGNATHVHEITKRVPAGRGRTKSCNTTGTESNGGYAEHAFNWDVAKRVKTVLTARGYHVLLTRHSDSGVGPCINERAAIGNRAHAAAVVSIHADGNTGSGNRGFHVEYSSPPLNSAQGRPSIALATDLRDAIASTGAVPISNYTGSHGLFGRDDLGGLNLSDRPTTLIECGNMRNARDEAVLGNAAGRQRFAAGIAAGIAEFTH